MRRPRSAGDSPLGVIVASAVVILALMLGGCGSTGGAGVGPSTQSSRPASPRSLDAVILAPSEVGPGYRERVYQDGRVVQGQVTLDLCGFRFASEALRTARLQVAYVKSRQEPVLSNEVVTYESGGTSAAMQELRQAVRQCPRTPVVGPVAGTPPTVYRLSEISDTLLLPGSLALAIRETALIGGNRKTQTTIAIYQTDGNTLSAVYAFGTNVTATRAMALHAAERSAHNLRST